MPIANWPRCAICVGMCMGGGHGKLERPGWGLFFWGGASVGMCVSCVPPMISACAAIGCRVCHIYCHNVAILGTNAARPTRSCTWRCGVAASKLRAHHASTPTRNSAGWPQWRVSRTRRASLQQGRTEGILCLADTRRGESRTSPHSAKGVPPNLRCLRPGHGTDHTI